MQISWDKQKNVKFAALKQSLCQRGNEFMSMKSTKLPEPDEEWKKKITPEQFRVLREKGTELPFTGKYNLHKEKGMYVCAGCGAELFSSDTKFDSGCGWPAFFAGISKNLETKEDNSL